MPLGWFVALRFMWEQRSQNLLMVNGVGVGVGVLVFISALIGGLQASLIERTTGSQAHVVVTPLELEGRPVQASEEGVAYLRRVERPVQRIRSIPEWRAGPQHRDGRRRDGDGAGRHGPCADRTLGR
jgi:lipoprotein-releasing system permease protein